MKISFDGWKQMALVTKSFFIVHIFLRIIDASTHLFSPNTLGIMDPLKPYGSSNMSGVAPSMHISGEAGIQILIFCFLVWPLAFKYPNLIKWMLFVSFVFILGFWLNDIRTILLLDEGMPMQIMNIVNPVMLLWCGVCLFVESRKKHSIE